MALPLDASSALANDKSSAPRIYSADLARIDTNLLHLPLFALGTRNLRSHPGISFTARKRIDDAFATITYRVSGNKDYGHPGPLSRKVHHALMAKLQDDQKMAPYHKAIDWEWHELQDRLKQSSRGGRNIEELKRAVAATHGATITTNLQLQHNRLGSNQPSKKAKGFHLYDSYTFVEDVLPDGTVADANFVLLSDWALANLNNSYVAPINYDLWDAPQ